MRKRKPTAIYLNGHEYDVVKEGRGQFTWWQVCEVYHRNEWGEIDYYKRLFGHGMAIHYKEDALKELVELERNGGPKKYKEKSFWKAPYVLRFHKEGTSGTSWRHVWYIAKVTGRYPTPWRKSKPIDITTTEYTYIDEQGDVRWVYSYDRDKIEQKIKEMNKKDRQEYEASCSNLVEIVDLRPLKEES